MNMQRSGRPAVGETVLVKGWGLVQFAVVDTSDPSLIVLEAPSGKQFRVGDDAVIPIDEQTDVRPTK